jgi:hypothetical protein
MNEEGVSIKVWVQGKFEDAIEQAAKGLEQGVSSYDHGELMGAVRAYHNVLVRLGPANTQKTECNASPIGWKAEYNVFNAWIDKICMHSPLTLGDAIDIYNFCDSNDLLKQQDIVENIITLGLRGHCRYDITNLLKLEALKGGKWIHKGIWRRKKHNE